MCANYGALMDFNQSLFASGFFPSYDFGKQFGFVLRLLSCIYPLP